MLRSLRLSATLAGFSILSAPAPIHADFSIAEIAAESFKANAFFENAYREILERSPETQAYLGLKTAYDKWDDDSDAKSVEDLAVALRQLGELKRTINPAALDPQTRLSYVLWERETAQAVEGFRWRFHNYPVNQLFGTHTEIPAFLINIHRISDTKDATAYVARLNGIGKKLDVLIAGLEERRARGIVPPRFVFPLVVESCRALIAGEPFDTSGKKNALLEDFERKVAALEGVESPVRERLLGDARFALTSTVKPAYERLIAALHELEKSATDDDGVWKFPDGAQFYNRALRKSTTTRLTADEIHELGLKEVARIRAEMDAIRQKVNFSGDLAAFFAFMRDDPRFYYPNTTDGKAAYLAEATAIVDRMRGRLDDLFLSKPKAPLVVKPVEAFREKETAGAFYYPPALDGSRPGVYYVNLYNMAARPKYEMEALAFHEGIPGHHMQLAIAQELDGLPKFRRVGYSYTAYVEGWGLYCERIPREIGFYADPYSDFGRLSMELWRAARLVVDTGLHAKKWTRRQTIDWLRANTPNSERDIANETNRYIVMPGQATAYKVGMIKLLELRERAARELGARFDLRAYHDIVLRNGALPLDLLEEQVNAWIEERRPVSP